MAFQTSIQLFMQWDERLDRCLDTLRSQVLPSYTQHTIQDHSESKMWDVESQFIVSLKSKNEVEDKKFSGSKVY